MKKTMRAAALVLLACALLAGCSSPDGGGSGIVVTRSLEGAEALVGDIPVEFPLSKDGDGLSVMIGRYGNIEPDTVYVWDKYEEMTGVNVNWISVSRDGRAEAVHTALTNGQSLDLIMRCKLSAGKLTQYGEGGLILDLAKDDLLKTYAPNCCAYLQSHPDTLASVTTPDGAIYSLPQVNSGAELRVALKLFVNRVWLENLDLQLPTTTEELYELLKAFRDQDANGNGDPGDEIPLCSANWQSVEQALYGAFGLGNRGFHNMTVDCDPETGGVRYIAASDAYRDFLEYVNRLYSEKLLDDRIFSMTDDVWQSGIANDRVGVFASTNLAWVPADKVGSWVGIGEALEGPNGDKLWSAIRANFHSTGAAVIPATRSDPELALRWLDYFWTDEGTLFYHMGVEGETFVVNGDGAYDYAPAIYDEIKTGNHSFDDVVASYSPYPGGSNPTVEIAPYFMGGEMAEIPARTARALFEYGPEEYWPGFTFTAEESDVLNAMQTDISKLSSSMLIRFVTGESPLTEWDGYVAQLEKLKLSDLLGVYEAAVGRYHALA